MIIRLFGGQIHRRRLLVGGMLQRVCCARGDLISYPHGGFSWYCVYFFRVCMCLYVQRHLCILFRMHVLVYACVYACLMVIMCVCLYMYMYVCAYIHISHTHTRIHIFIHIQYRMHVYMSADEFLWVLDVCEYYGTYIHNKAGKTWPRSSLLA